MDIPVLQHLASGNAWGAIWPELALGCLALALLLLEVALPRGARRHIPAIAVLGQAAVLAGLLAGFHGVGVGRETFNGLLRHSHQGQVMRVFFVLSSILVCLLARVGRARRRMPRVEFNHVVIVVAAAMMPSALVSGWEKDSPN